MNILSFDLEDWFHILGHPANNDMDSWQDYDSNLEESVDKILDLLHRYQQKATFFCLGWIADKYPRLIRKIGQEGHETGSHTYAHRRISEYSLRDFYDDVERSVKTIEDISGNKVTSFRFPGFQINTDYLWALEILAELGIKTDSSVQLSYRNARNSKKSYPARIISRDKQINEFPVPVVSFLENVFYRSGSGYFRLFPWSYTGNFLRKNNYNMVYFHPRDIYPAPARHKAYHPIRRFKSSKGMGSAADKLELLLSEFSFTDIKTANEKIDWEMTRVFRYEDK